MHQSEAYRTISERAKLFDENVPQHFWVRNYYAWFAANGKHRENLAVFFAIFVHLQMHQSLVSYGIPQMTNKGQRNGSLGVNSPHRPIWHNPVKIDQKYG